MSTPIGGDKSNPSLHGPAKIHETEDSQQATENSLKTFKSSDDYVQEAPQELDIRSVPPEIAATRGEYNIPEAVVDKVEGQLWMEVDENLRINVAKGSDENTRGIDDCRRAFQECLACLNGCWDSEGKFDVDEGRKALQNVAAKMEQWSEVEPEIFQAAGRIASAFIEKQISGPDTPAAKGATIDQFTPSDFGLEAKDPDNVDEFILAFLYMSLIEAGDDLSGLTLGDQFSVVSHEKLQENVGDLIQSLEQILEINTPLPEGPSVEGAEDDFSAEAEQYLSMRTKVPEESVFHDTDLVIFEDAVGTPPIVNGILKSEFDEIEQIYQGLVDGTGNLTIDSDNPEFKSEVLVSLKELLTRDVGRHLIKDIMKEKISFSEGETNHFLGNKIELNPKKVKNINAWYKQADGRSIPQKVTLTDVLAHELVHCHHSIYDSGYNGRSRVRHPTYDNNEELLTITGTSGDQYNPISEWQIRADITRPQQVDPKDNISTIGIAREFHDSASDWSDDMSDGKKLSYVKNAITHGRIDLIEGLFREGKMPAVNPEYMSEAVKVGDSKMCEYLVSVGNAIDDGALSSFLLYLNFNFSKTIELTERDWEFLTFLLDNCSSTPSEGFNLFNNKELLNIFLERGYSLETAYEYNPQMFLDDIDLFKNIIDAGIDISRPKVGGGGNSFIDSSSVSNGIEYLLKNEHEEQVRHLQQKLESSECSFEGFFDRREVKNGGRVPFTDSYGDEHRLNSWQSYLINTFPDSNNSGYYLEELKESGCWNYIPGFFVKDEVMRKIDKFMMFR
jgi:hypothetical protein